MSRSSNIPYNQLGPSNSNPSLNGSRYSYYSYDEEAIAAHEQQLGAIQEGDERELPPVPTPRSPLPPGAAAPVPRFYGLAASDGGPQPSIDSTASFGGPYSYHDAEEEPFSRLSQDQQRRLSRLAAAAGVGAGASSPGIGHVDSPFLAPEPYRDDPYSASNNASAVPIPLEDVGPDGGRLGFREYTEKRSTYASPRDQSRRKMFKGAVIALTVVGIIAAVGIPVYLFAIRPHQQHANASSSDSAGESKSGTSSSGDGKGKGTSLVTGTDGSTVTTDNGTTFTYHNQFGGYWYWDPTDPFNDGARAQSYVPPLNESWDWNNNRIFGVNLGGWLNTEPFISPDLYEPFYPNAVDEWTLSELLANTSQGLQAQLEAHYATFITEQDFAQIAAAGLNWVRIPLPFWAIQTWPGEPFLEGVAWQYFLKGIQWARKYGIRINLDFHATPGSQNGWNHSGRLGQPNFLFGPMGLANADRALDYLRVLTQFISQPQYKNVIPMLGVLNEALTPNIGTQQMYSFYYQVHNTLRAITGFGEGNGPILSLHDGFVGVGPWAGQFPGADRVGLDIHPYFAFAEQSSAPMSQQALRACQTWASGTNSSMGDFGITAAGEFSNAINDCGTYVNGVGLGTRYEGTFPGWTQPAIGNCSQWVDYQNYDAQTKSDMMTFAMASMDSLTHWFFWTWKINPNPASGQIEAPFWSYQLGLQEGWMPTDPRQAYGVCSSLGVAPTSAPPLPASATGAAGYSTISAAYAASYSAWPVTSLTNAADAGVLPTYTATGAMVTLAGPTFTTPGSTATYDAGNGWFNPADTVGAHVAVSGCTYPDEYDLDLAPANQFPIPTAAWCGSAGQKRAAAPEPTAAPDR